jgi:hypothetical protein
VYKTTISRAVLYGCKTLSTTRLEEKHRLRVFENRVLRGACICRRETEGKGVD